MARFDLDAYVTVQERIVQFWQDHPNGRILTSIESPATDFKQCRYKAEVYRTEVEQGPAATGWAFELAGGSGPNSTSHEENCETSAIGRALANLGYATSQKDRPSREEMSKVQRHSPDTERVIGVETRQEASPTQIKFLHAVAREAGYSPDQLDQVATERFGMQLHELSRRDTSTLIEQFQAMRGQVAGNPNAPDIVQDLRQASQHNAHPNGNGVRMASDAQKRLIFGVCKGMWQFGSDDTKDFVFTQVGKSIDDLTLDDAKKLIDMLKAEESRQQPV